MLFDSSTLQWCGETRPSVVHVMRQLRWRIRPHKDTVDELVQLWRDGTLAGAPSSETARAAALFMGWFQRLVLLNSRDPFYAAKSYAANPKPLSTAILNCTQCDDPCHDLCHVTLSHTYTVDAEAAPTHRALHAYSSKCETRAEAPLNTPINRRVHTPQYPQI